jgi:hypothetical protein
MPDNVDGFPGDVEVHLEVILTAYEQSRCEEVMHGG